MRRGLILILLGLAALAFWGWWSGGLERLGAWAAAHQRDFQNQMALALRAVRAGQAGGLWLLLGVCFAYGFFHAVGPGHGKVLIGGYGLGRQVSALRLSVITSAASLGQAVTAVALVQVGAMIFALGREELVGTTEAVLAPASYGAICLIGAWLAGRGLLRIWRQRATHDHHHEEGVCPDCGHRHGPSLAEVEQAGTLREAAALILGIALRPCTGALFVLVITYGMGIAWVGIAGAFAMALGTAAVTLAVGLGALGLRGGLLRAVADSPLAAGTLPLIELAAGGMVILVAGGLLLRSLGGLP
jgi:ABC-type nickel/cobalt efflux system permease component RcnA